MAITETFLTSKTTKALRLENFSDLLAGSGGPDNEGGGVAAQQLAWIVRLQLLMGLKSEGRVC